MNEGDHYWDSDKQEWIDQDNLMIGDEEWKNWSLGLGIKIYVNILKAVKLAV